jgi:hypothetical protein
VPDLPLTGSCGCGGVRFEVSEAPVGATYCHCRRCQKRTGTAASIQARIAPGSLHVTSGEELIREWRPEGGFPKAFCSECGSALWTVNPANGMPVAVRFGAFDSDPGVRPGFRQFTAYAAEWEPIPDDGLPRHPERPTA